MLRFVRRAAPGSRVLTTQGADSRRLVGHRCRAASPLRPICLGAEQLAPWQPIATLLMPFRLVQHRQFINNRCTRPDKVAKVGSQQRCFATVSSSVKPTDLDVVIDVLIEGDPLPGRVADTQAISEQLAVDGRRAVQEAVHKLWQEQGSSTAPRPIEVSVVLCGDEHISELNSEWRGVEGPTDVLSFALQEGDEDDDGDGDVADDVSAEYLRSMGEDERDSGGASEDDEQGGGGGAARGSGRGLRVGETLEHPPHGAHLGSCLTTPDEDESSTEPVVEGQYPNLVLGDVVISLQTAERQAEERGHSLADEVRVLLVHGLLHLLGYDHETGEEDAAEMAAEERRILLALGWDGKGLIAAAEDVGEHVHASSPSVTSDDSLATTDWEEVVEPDLMPDDEDNDDNDGGEGGASSPSPSPSSVVSSASSSNAGDASSASPSSSPSSVVSSASSSKAQPPPVMAPRAGRANFSRGIRLLALDMDGTLLDSNSKVLPSSVEAIRIALSCGVMVCLATGKARPAAMQAMQAVGLAGQGLVVCTQGPGIFLQGLTVYGAAGEMLAGASLGREVVRQAFEYSQQERVPCVAFLGDECATLELTPELVDLHETYYEPLARVEPGVGALLEGPPVKKLLFMTQPEVVANKLKPYWEEAAPLLGAQAIQAVPSMLELVPAGMNKWVGARALLADLGVPREALMVVGDGANDLQLIANAGVGVAMANAVPEVKDAATYVSRSNDEDGVALAIERFIM